MSYFGKFIHLRMQGAIGQSVYNKGGGSAPAPDPMIGIAQNKMADLSQEQFDSWKKDVFPMLQQSQQQQASRSDQYFDLAQKQANQDMTWGQQQHDIGMQVQQQQLASAKTNQQNADDYTARMKNVFYPIEDKIVQDAKNYNTDGNIERQSALAMGDVNTAFGNQRQQQQMSRAAYGIDPTSGNSQALDQQGGVQQAAAAAAAGTRARDAAVQLGWAKNMDAASLGRGLPSSQATSTQLGMANGNSGIAAGNAGSGQFGAALGAAGAGLQAGQVNYGNIQGLGNSNAQGFGGAIQGWGSIGNLSNQQYGIQSSNWRQQQQDDASSSAGYGQLAGTLGAAAIMAF